MYDYNELVCHKYGYQTLVIEFTPIHYCSIDQLKSSESVSNATLNIKEELALASVREGSWSEREDC